MLQSWLAPVESGEGPVNEVRDARDPEMQVLSEGARGSGLVMRERRAVSVRLPMETLARMIEVPEGCWIRAVETSNDPLSVKVLVEGPQFPIVPDDSEAPRAALFYPEADEALSARARTPIVLWPSGKAAR